MAERITRESWEMIASNMINIMEENINDYDAQVSKLEEYLINEGIIDVIPEYRYGMRLRGFAPMCQPKNGFLERKDDPTGKYYDIIVYSRKLTERELRDYELDDLN